MKKFFKNIGKAFIEGRQARANYEIATILQRTELPHEDINHIMLRIKNGTISEII